jgi:hypothetical protein
MSASARYICRLCRTLLESNSDYLGSLLCALTADDAIFEPLAFAVKRVFNAEVALGTPQTESLQVKLQVCSQIRGKNVTAEVKK